MCVWGGGGSGTFLGGSQVPSAWGPPESLKTRLTADFYRHDTDTRVINVTSVDKQPRGTVELVSCLDTCVLHLK